MRRVHISDLDRRALGQDSVASTPAAMMRCRHTKPHDPNPICGGLFAAHVLMGQRFQDAVVEGDSRSRSHVPTQILGCQRFDPVCNDPALPVPSYSHWTTPGPGINPGANASSGVLSPSAFTDQFAVSFVDHALDPTNLVVALVSRQSGNSHRFFVERTHAASSRQSAAGVDTSTLSLGSVSTTGRAYLRADSFTGARHNRESDRGRQHPANRCPRNCATAVNTPSQVGGVNSATDSTNSVYIVRTTRPYSTPAVSDATGFIERR